MSNDPQNPPQQLEVAEQDSDAELEAALPELEADDDEFNAAPIMAGVSLPSQSSGPRSASGFKLPPNPAIPQDLSLIAEMVSSHQVVGALPPLSISAAEKRRLVEASMRSGKDKGKGREIEGVVPSPSHVKQVPSGEEGNDSDSDSDSSSEFLSDVDDEEADKPVPDKPMTATEHAEIKANLDRLVQATGTADDEDSDSSSEEDEEEGQGVAEFEFSSSPIPSPRGLKIPLDMMDDDEELATGDPILSIHEVPLPPVPQPPVGKLPSGEAMSLAGDVVSWMKEKKVEAWVEREREQAQAQTLALTQAQTQPVEKSNPKGELKNASSQDLGVSKGSEAEIEGGDEIAVEGESPGNQPSFTINAEQVPKTSQEQESSAETIKAPLPSESSSVPRFNSAGTVVVRAMQERPGQEGWLEEGSVLCWSDGRVLGTVRSLPLVRQCAIADHIQLGIRHVRPSYLPLLFHPATATTSPLSYPL
jgi:H/ACA ribonucleoprotein complex non-core subunit NAF1